MKKYTIIVHTIRGNELGVEHFETKAGMIRRISELIALCYQVKIMKYWVWKQEYNR